MNELTPDEHRILVDAIHDSAIVIHKGQRMNERIRELAKQAGFKVNWQHEDVQAIKMAQYTEFAELIVRECIQQVEQAKNSPFVSLDDANRMKHFVDVTKKKIQKHFGVK